MQRLLESMTTKARYGLYGVLLGLCFIVISTLIRFYTLDLPLGISSIALAHKSDSLFWVIDLLPGILGILGMYIGARQQSLENISHQLEKRVVARTREIKESYKRHDVINALLRLSLDSIPLKEQLGYALDILLSTSWLKLQNKGAIFLVDKDQPNHLELEVHRNLDQSILTMCQSVPFGHCLCGRVARDGEFLHSEHNAENHEIWVDGMHAHAHYHLPIMFGKKVKGVVVLYLEDGHLKNSDEVDFLKAVVDTIAGMLTRFEAEQQLRMQGTVLQAAANAVVISDKNGIIQWVNPAFTMITGYTYREAIGAKTSFIRSGLHDEAFYKNLWQTIQSGDVWHDEITNRRRDGSIYISDLTITPIIGGDGQIDKFVAVQQEITERKRAQEEVLRQKQYFETLIQASPIAVVILDLEHLIVDCNQAFEELFGYSKSEVIGNNIDNLIVQEDDFNSAVQNSLDVGKGKCVHQIVHRQRKDGSLVDVEMFALPVRVDGEKAAQFALYHDISELVKARQDAEAAANTKADFLANMSHEIRTPLNAIIGMTGLLLDTPLSSEQREFAHTVRTSGDSLLSIINDILDFSKIEAGKLELEQQPFIIREVVETSLDLITSEAQEKGLELAYILDGDTPAAIVGDVTRVRQVLVNLLGNAVKFTEKGEVVIRVEGCARNDGLYDIDFSIRDTGIGIPADRVDSLFQSFTQVDASTTRKYGGTGLGLAISRQLVELMEGKIWVESEVDKGSTFHFLIPAAPAPGSQTIEDRKAPEVLFNQRVLIVDDNATNRLILIRQAKAWGLEPRAASSGQEALEWIGAGEQFDLAILDMQMPEMDGVMLAKEIRKKRHKDDFPLILFSSLGGLERIPKDIEFSARLTKPIKPSLLYDAIVNVMSHQVDLPTVVPLQEDEAHLDQIMGERHPLQILLAEDNLVNQKVALRILDKLGYRADVAANGLEVLESLERQHYDVVLMDIQMPEMDGEEATRQIQENYSQNHRPRIIAMTAHAMEGDRERYLSQGMDDYVSKPVRVQELVKALEHCQPHR